MRKLVSIALKAAAGLALVASAASANAATLLTNGARLTGATGVAVGSDTYTVTFLDGSCSSLYAGCDANLFSFNNSLEAGAAATALLDQVFIAAFDIFPGLTDGCSSFLALGNCRVLIPYAVSGSNAVSAFALNGVLNDSTGSAQISQTTDTTISGSLTYALFDKENIPNPSSVPEPSTWLLMMAGFGVAGFALRRGKAADRRVAFA